MSLCRWSSNNWACDLYCYYDCNGGITIHVAAFRTVGEVPHLPNLSEVPVEEFGAAYKKQMDYLDTVKKEPIGLPEDGETFNVDSIEEFRNQLTYLRKLGYNFPDCLFKADEEPE